MKYIDGFRNPGAAAGIRAALDTLAEQVEKQGQRVNVMEVCGSHTMAIGRYGIRDILPDCLKLVSGPGCPVCVTPAGYIDTAIELAASGCIVATFGDMLNVPGSDTSLESARAEGGRVETCYSPTVALELAREHPEAEVVFLAIGFETTVAPVVSLVESAAREQLDNLSLLTAFKLVPPALEALMTDEELQIDAFLCPAHVSAIIGANAYQPVVDNYGIPCVVAGFEPLDILLGLQGILEQVVSGKARVDNQYSRVVTPGGNTKAQQMMTRYLEPVDAPWRGIGVIPASGLGLRDEVAQYDAEKRHNVTVEMGRESPGCLCGDVIKGKCGPQDCPLFATGCTPEHPIGPCMVSSEGSCAAYFKYSR